MMVTPQSLSKHLVKISMPNHTKFDAKPLVEPRNRCIHYDTALNNNHHLSEIFGILAYQCYDERWHGNVQQIFAEAAIFG
jgi:hypothetical protein